MGMDLITHIASNWQSYLGVITAVLAAAWEIIKNRLLGH